jgi:hypothetical protein
MGAGGRVVMISGIDSIRFTTGHSALRVGKWAIHPSQIDIANEVYSLTKDEVARAKMAEVYAKAEAEGLGAVTHEGVMIDLVARVVQRGCFICQRTST